MTGIVEWLEKVNQQDTRLKAELKRSIAFVPGTYPRAFPYIEPWTSSRKLGENQRSTYYLIAGLWAIHWREGFHSPGVSLGKACLAYKSEKSASSMDIRFTNLLEADEKQLPNRLRQMIGLLKDINVDFELLLSDVLSWTTDDKRVQIRWAREYFSASSEDDFRRNNDDEDAN